MSRMFLWERWPTILLGSIYTCLMLLDLTMGSMHVVPSTCGLKFFLPSFPKLPEPVDLVGWVEVVACRDSSLTPVPVTLEVYTASGDVVHTMSVLSNHTTRVEKASFRHKLEDLDDGFGISASQKVSAYAHVLHNGSDVMTLIPMDALSTSYLIPDLRTSASEEQYVVFFSEYSNTNVTVTKTQFTETTEHADVSHKDTDVTNASREGVPDGGSWGKNGGGIVSVKNDADSVLSTVTMTSKISEKGEIPSSTLSSSSSSPSTTTVKATPTSLDAGDGDGDSSNQGDAGSDESATTVFTSSSSSSSSSSSGFSRSALPTAPSAFFFSSALQTMSVTLQKNCSLSLHSNKPLGVMVMVVAGGVRPSPSTVSTTPPAAAASSSAEGDMEMRVTMEMVPPSSTFGKYFYLPLQEGVRGVTFVASGRENATVDIFWDPTNASQAVRRTLAPSQSLVLEQPERPDLPPGYVWMVSTSPLLVYVVTEFCAAEQEGDSGCYVSSFILPPVEQYFRCAADVSENACDIICPSFWNSVSCRKSVAVNSSEPVDADTGAADVMPVPDTKSGSASTDRSQLWQIQHQVNVTSPHTSELCVTANSSYLPFRADVTSGSFSPAGTRLAQLYGACVPSISQQGGNGDGADNDCDGFVDEEVENMADDDGDGRIDEDTSSDCETDVASRKARSGDLQKAVADASAPVWPFADYEAEESEMPLFAVIISLSVAIFAVIAVISIFLLMELMSRRRQIRNTKIRPFVS